MREDPLFESQMLATREFVEAPWRYEHIAGAKHWLQLTAASAVNELLLDDLS